MLTPHDEIALDAQISEPSIELIMSKIVLVFSVVLLVLSVFGSFWVAKSLLSPTRVFAAPIGSNEYELQVHASIEAAQAFVRAKDSAGPAVPSRVPVPSQTLGESRPTGTTTSSK